MTLVMLASFIKAALLPSPFVASCQTLYFLTVFMNSYGLFSFSYLDRGFPLKSAISKALQNLMLSGISGMSAGEKRRPGETGVSTMDIQM